MCKVMVVLEADQLSTNYSQVQTLLSSNNTVYLYSTS